MGLFSGILGTVGSFFGGPIGGAIGGVAGGLFDSDQAEEGVRDQNNNNVAVMRETNAFNADQANLNREWTSTRLVSNVTSITPRHNEPVSSILLRLFVIGSFR